MKLKEYTPENCLTGSTTRPIIGLNTNSGKISFNLAAVEYLNIPEPGYIRFLQDEEYPENWYIEVVKDGGFELKPQKLNGYRGRIIRNASIAKKIADSVGFKGTSGKILLAGQPTKFESRTLHGLIVTTLNNK